MTKTVYTMTKKDAEECLFAPLTKHYTIDEEWMLNRVILDLQKDDIEFVLVSVKHCNTKGIEIWRLQKELNLDDDEN